MNLNLGQIDLKQKVTQRETVIFIATLVVACLGFFRGCVVPNQKAIDDSHEQIEALEAELRQLNNKGAETLQSKLWVGTSAAVNQSIDFLAKPLRLRGIQVVSLDLAETSKKGDPYIKKNVTLTLSGNFISIGDYIEYLENLSLPLLIESLSVAPDGGKPSIVTVKIQGGFYEAN